MGRESITRTAPGWEERTTTLLASASRSADGVGSPVSLYPGFARIAALLDVPVFGGGGGLQVWLQHSPDGSRWMDLAAFNTVASSPHQVLWMEAQPELAGAVEPATDGALSTGELRSGFIFPRLRVRWTVGGVSHTFGVDLVAIYERKGVTQ
jgi:hypothetical protein